MPTESALPAEADTVASRHPPPALLPLKCSVCGLGALGNGVRSIEDIASPLDPVCSSCVRSQRTRYVVDANALALGVDSVENDVGERRLWNTARIVVGGETADSCEDDQSRIMIEPVPIPRQSLPSPLLLHSHSLPSQPTRPWTTSSTTISHAIPESPASPESTRSAEEDVDVPPNPLLDVSRSRMPSVGRGALYPGSVFKGTQTSGRSAYEVEVRILVRVGEAFRPARVELTAGCQLPGIVLIWLPIHITSYRRASTSYYLLHRRDHRPQIRLHHRCQIRGNRARRHATLGTVRAVPPPVN